MTGRAAQKAESIKLVALDVDGVMTDGTLFYRAMSEPETKPFNIKDGLGIKLLQRCDIRGRDVRRPANRDTIGGLRVVTEQRAVKIQCDQTQVRHAGLPASVARGPARHC